MQTAWTVKNLNSGKTMQTDRQSPTLRINHKSITRKRTNIEHNDLSTYWSTA